jgi:formylmethanofuran dehydrogenase subunit E
MLHKTRCCAWLPFVATLPLLAILAAPTTQAQTREEWIAFGTRVHGGFGAFIPVGIRIGQDALKRLNAEPRDVSVTYYDSDKAPCACIADGIMIATTATPGQRTLAIAAEKAPAGAMAVALVKHRKTGAEVKYTVPEAWLPKLFEINKKHDPAGRYEEIMKAEGLFEVSN